MKSKDISTALDRISFERYGRPTAMHALIPRRWWFQEPPEICIKTLTDDGWIPGYDIEPARFKGGKLDPAKVRRLVIHCGSTGSDKFGRYFANPYGRNSKGERVWRKVSCHFSVSSVRFDGICHLRQHVSLHRQAYHAGRKANSNSVGIEFPGPHDREWPGEYGYAVLQWAEQMQEFFPNANVIQSHSSISPKRRRDPGKDFPYGLLEAAGYRVIK